MTVEEVAGCDFGALDIDGIVSGCGHGIDACVYDSDGDVDSDFGSGKRGWTGSGGGSDDEDGGAAGAKTVGGRNGKEQEAEIAIENDDAVA